MDDLRTILQKNQSSELDATNPNSVKESTVNAGLPKEWKTPRDLTLLKNLSELYYDEKFT